MDSVAACGTSWPAQQLPWQMQALISYVYILAQYTVGRLHWHGMMR